MTTQLLSSELSNLIQETKRRYPDLRAAAEKSLVDLRSLPATSEQQVNADLRRRPDFVRPFLLACKTGNSKHASLSVVSLQRLVAANGFSPDKLDELLESLRDCISFGTDVQLRVLQIMPTLFQQYGDRITESRLATALRLCFLLQASKNGIISNTAAATLQQVVNVVFSRIGSDISQSEATSPETTRISWQAELDCHQVLQDLCFIAEGKSVKSLDKASVSKDFAFELIGSILVNYTAVIPRYTNFIDILRQQLLPLVLRVLSSNEPFNSTVRALRLIPPIAEGFLEILPTELEMLLSILTYMLEPEAAPAWKRVMCVEVIRELYKETSNVRRAYIIFDQQDGHKPIVYEQLTMISRLASEKPNIIGLGQSSSLPTTTEQSGEDLDGLSALQADPLTATTGVSLTTKTSMDSGISSDASTLKISLIDQLDKSDPPKIPPSYIYAVALTGLNNLCEGMARFILPFATSKGSELVSQRSSSAEGKGSFQEGDKGYLPTNPYDLKTHRDFEQISATFHLLQECWPAMLSTYSTFFQAALDPDFYHGAIRAFQKLIQIVTLFRLATPRGELLTALAKQSLPSEVAITGSREVQGPTKEDIKSTTDLSVRLTPRNLLCLRALLNLGIALGAVLDDSWTIIIGTLRQADIIIGQISTDRTLSKNGPAAIAPATVLGGELSRDFGSEISAVRSAASRMLNSTSELPSRKFLEFLEYLRGQIYGVTSSSPSSPSIGFQLSDYSRSESSTGNASLLKDIRGKVFIIDAFSQISNFNSSRFATGDPEVTGWSMLINSLSAFVAEEKLDGEVRVAAADTICKSVLKATTGTGTQVKIHCLIPYGFSVLCSLAKVILRMETTSSAPDPRMATEEIHNLILHTLKSCLDENGEHIESGWENVCELLLSAFHASKIDAEPLNSHPMQSQPISPKLLRSAFSSLQSVCSDIVESIPLPCIPNVLRAVNLCCHQTLDLNISLTATTLYQSISDRIWTGKEYLELVEENVTLQDSDSSPERLWMQTLSALCDVSAVVQSEVRSSAVHACFRILSGVRENLKPQHWGICIRYVIIALYDFNKNARKPFEENGDTVSMTSYDETAAAIQDGTCELLEDSLSSVLEWNGFTQIWPLIGDEFSALLSRSSLALSTEVYLGLNRILYPIDDESRQFSTCSPTLWDMWEKHNPCEHERLDRPASTDNQKALIAYVTFAMNLYKVSTIPQRADVAHLVLREIKRSVSGSTGTGYVSDLHNTTNLQDDCLRLLDTIYENTDISISPIFLSFAGDLAILPYTIERTDKEMRGPTFVAFSKSVLKVVSKCIRDRTESCNLHEKAETVKCLEGLRTIIHQKTVWKREDQHITIWKDSIKTAVESSSPLLKRSRIEGFPKTSFRTWKAVLLILDSSLNSGSDGGEGSDTLRSDIDFEIGAFTELFELLVPNLGSEQLPNEARQKFAEILLLRSLIHEIHPEDSLDPSEKTTWPNARRIGRVGDVPPRRHSKLCYLILDRMFSIVQFERRSEEYGRLAKAIAPYLLLRSELVMKAYISDQPLRGRMPCPLSQKRELLHILQKSMEITKCGKNCTGDEVSEEKGNLGVLHVRCLAELAIAAMRATRYDEEIRDELTKIIEL